MPVDFPAKKDNRLNILHPARFRPGVFRWQQAVKESPVAQKPLCGNLPLRHIGLDCLNLNTNKVCHDRSTTLLQLKMFTNDNLRMTREDPHFVPTRTGFKQARETKEIKDVGEAVLALNNLCDIWRFFHPYDPSMQAIFRVVLEHYVAGSLEASGIGAINNFFKVATLENAHSASNEASNSFMRVPLKELIFRACL